MQQQCVPYGSRSPGSMLPPLMPAAPGGYALPQPHMFYHPRQMAPPPGAADASAAGAAAPGGGRVFAGGLHRPSPAFQAAATAGQLAGISLQPHHMYGGPPVGMAPLQPPMQQQHGPPPPQAMGAVMRAQYAAPSLAQQGWMAGMALPPPPPPQQYAAAPPPNQWPNSPESPHQ